MFSLYYIFALLAHSLELSRWAGAVVSDQLAKRKGKNARRFVDFRFFFFFQGGGDTMVLWSSKLLELHQAVPLGERRKSTGSLGNVFMVCLKVIKNRQPISVLSRSFDCQTLCLCRFRCEGRDYCSSDPLWNEHIRERLISEAHQRRSTNC